MDSMADEKLIRAVEKRRILYDVTHTLYKNNAYRRRLWNDVSLEIRIPVDLCQKKWKRLRERYSDMNKNKKSGSATKLNKYSSLIKMMGFLKPFIKDNPSTFNPMDTDEETRSSSNTTLREFFAETDPDTLEDNIQIEYQNRSDYIYDLEDRLNSPAEVVASTPIQSHNDILNSPAEVVASTPKKSRLEKNKTTEISELIEILKEPVVEHDSVDYYCMSLANDMKKMEILEQWRIRLEITKIMCTAKFKDLI